MRTFFNWVHSLAYVVKGARALRKGDDDGVIENYSRAIEISPEDLDYYYARGHAYWHKRELGLAIADFTKVIDLNPGNVYARLVRGAIFQERGDLLRAMQDLNDVIDATEEAPMAYYLRAACYAENEEYDLALADLDKALALDPADDKARKLQDRVRGQLHLLDHRKSAGEKTE